MAKELQKIGLPNGTYYVDWRLLQIRNVDDPHDFITFTDSDAMEAYLKIYRY